MPIWFAILSCLVLAGCTAPKDMISLKATPDQSAIVRDGVPALVSSKRHVVFLRPVDSRQQSNDRPRFVIAMLNKGKSPATFNVADISVTSYKPHQAKLKVYTHEELADEVEADRNTRLVLAALGGAAGAMSAANAGTTYTTGSYGHSSPYGHSSGMYTASTYNPGLAQAAINANNDRTLNNISSIEGQAQNALANLKATIVKDHTVMPGEWHGGVIVLGTPEKGAEGAEYQISLLFDGEEHTFSVSQRRT